MPDLDPAKPDLDPVYPDLDPAPFGARSGLFGVESDQTQLMVKVPASSYFNMPTPHKVCLVWFHFRLTAG